MFLNDQIPKTPQNSPLITEFFYVYLDINSPCKSCHMWVIYANIDT